MRFYVKPHDTPFAMASLPQKESVPWPDIGNHAEITNVTF
jgi:hypothetical protein